MNKASSIIKAELSAIKEAGYDLPDQQLFPIWAIAVIHFDGNLDQASLEEAYSCTQALVDETGDPNTDLWGYFHAEGDNQLFLYHFRQTNISDEPASASDARQVGKLLQVLKSETASINELPESRKA